MLQYIPDFIFRRAQERPESFVLGGDTIPAGEATLRHLREGRRNYAAAQESTSVRRTPEQGGYADPIGDALKSFWGWATTPLRRDMGGPSPRDINIQNPNDPRNRQIVDQLGPQEQDLITQAYVGPDERSPVRRWWDSTQFPPAAAARGAWNTFVGQATPLDLALEVGGAALATRGSRGAMGIGGATAHPAPTTRGGQSQIMRAFDETGNIPFEEYGTYGQDIIERMLEEADRSARGPSSGTSIADDAFRMADEATRSPDVTDINTRRGNLNLPEGGSLMGRGTPETGPTGYTPHGGSLLDDALSGRPADMDQIPYTPEYDPVADWHQSFIEDGGVIDETLQQVNWNDPITADLARFYDDFGVEDIGDVARVVDGIEGEDLVDAIRHIQDADGGVTKRDLEKLYPNLSRSDIDDAFMWADSGMDVDELNDFASGILDEEADLIDEVDEALRWHDSGSSIEDVRKAYGDEVADIVEGEVRYRRAENPIDDAYLDAPEYLDDPGSPDAIEAAQEKKINDQIEAWHNKNRDIIDDAFNGLTKDELRAKYPDADDLTLDMVLDYKAEEDAFEALFSDEALEGADEYLDLDGGFTDITEDLRKVQNGEMNLRDLADKYPELTYEEIQDLADIHITDSEIDEAVDAFFGPTAREQAENLPDFGELARQQRGGSSAGDDAIEDALNEAGDSATLDWLIDEQRRRGSMPSMPSLDTPAEAEAFDQFESLRMGLGQADNEIRDVVFRDIRQTNPLPDVTIEPFEEQTIREIIEFELDPLRPGRTAEKGEIDEMLRRVAEHDIDEIDQLLNDDSIDDLLTPDSQDRFDKHLEKIKSLGPEGKKLLDALRARINPMAEHLQRTHGPGNMHISDTIKRELAEAFGLLE